MSFDIYFGEEHPSVGKWGIRFKNNIYIYIYILNKLFLLARVIGSCFLNFKLHCIFYILYYYYYYILVKKRFLASPLCLTAPSISLRSPCSLNFKVFHLYLSLSLSLSISLSLYLSLSLFFLVSLFMSNIYLFLALCLYSVLVFFYYYYFFLKNIRCWCNLVTV